MHWQRPASATGTSRRPARSRAVARGEPAPAERSRPKGTRRRPLQFPGLSPEACPKQLLPEEIAFMLEEMWQRNRRGWSMEQVAGFARLKRQEIGQLERWQHGLRYGTAIRIAAAFGMTIEAFSRAARKRWLPLGKKKRSGKGGKK